jgi:hypothetical protein
MPLALNNGGGILSFLVTRQSSVVASQPPSVVSVRPSVRGRVCVCVCMCARVVCVCARARKLLVLCDLTPPCAPTRFAL